MNTANKSNAMPIAAAVLPLKAEAIDRAEKEARQQVTWAVKKLEAAGWDLKKVAPRPDGNLPRNQYSQMEADRKFFFGLVNQTNRTSFYEPSAPELVEMDSERVEAFIRYAREDAANQYDAFIAKLEEKVGAGVLVATLSGNHVWGHSILEVTKTGGTVEKWKTQMIVNISKLGKVFNQFPTRKTK